MQDAAAGYAVRLDRAIRTQAVRYRLSRTAAWIIVLFPVMAFFVWAVLLVLPPTRLFATWVLRENHPVELLTFAFAFAGAMRGAILAIQLGKLREPWWTVAFFALFALGLLFVAGEEVAWGQWFLGFETPAPIRAVNAQGEFTLHNIEGLHGHNEFFRLSFGLGGILGVAIAGRPMLEKVSASPLLLSWFLMNVAHATFDLWSDFFPFADRFEFGGKLDWYLGRTSELNEMLIAGAGFLFVWLRGRATKAHGTN